MTSWVEKHPGGDIIGLAAGRESTALVYSYHPYSVFDILKKYYIGEVGKYPFKITLLIQKLVVLSERAYAINGFLICLFFTILNNFIRFFFLNFYIKL